MMRYHVQPRDQIFVKGFGFLSFAKNRYKNTGKNISKTLSNKDSQKLLDHAEKSATDANCFIKSNSENSRKKWCFN